MEGSPIGSVVLVVHGSVDELAAIPKYVANKVPLVILSGCGGIADVLAKGLQLLGYCTVPHHTVTESFRNNSTTH